MCYYLPLIGVFSFCHIDLNQVFGYFKIFLQQKPGLLRLIVVLVLRLLNIDGNQLLIVDEPDVD